MILVILVKLFLDTTLTEEPVYVSAKYLPLFIPEEMLLLLSLVAPEEFPANV